jgi:poly(A) polymerase
MAAPRIVPRAEHPISRRDIDPDALKVLYRLRQFDHIAYLVGGSVRDLLVGRRPKDFDIGTSAHPYQVKRLFRNCWIIGRRFRLAHVKFGSKIIEVATFRRQLQPGEEIVQDGVPAPDPNTPEGEHLIHHDNTFGTAEEDAFRRDFTINALAYDIATLSIIDYVGGLDDLKSGIVRSIGDPVVRLREDPVRMLRAVALAARLDFAIDPLTLDAIRAYRHEIGRSSPPRLLEEYYKILRAGAAEKTFRMLAELGLLEPISGELHRGAGDALWRSLAELDAYRRRFETTPDALTNTVLLGTLLTPLEVPLMSAVRSHDRARPERRQLAAEGAPDAAAGATDSRRGSPPRRPPVVRLGLLPLPRRDTERLRQVLAMQRRLRDVTASTRAQRAVAHRSLFREALTWLEVHGNVPDVVEAWKTLLARPPAEGEGIAADTPPPGGRRRRRRRRRRRQPIRPAQS